MIGKIQPDMIGQKFERLLVLSYDKEMSKQRGYDCYLCRCNCGVEKLIRGLYLRRECTRSCGCLSREVHSKLGERICGENNPNYYCGFFEGRGRFRKIIHERNKVCQLCGMTKKDHLLKYGTNLECHHLDGDNINNASKNGALLCKLCHLTITRGNNVWRPA